MLRCALLLTPMPTSRVPSRTGGPTGARSAVADIHWIDAFYRAYLTGIIGLVAVVAISGAIGDGDVSSKGVHDILVHGTPWLGGIAAMAIALGLRSGSRGGPAGPRALGRPPRAAVAGRPHHRAAGSGDPPAPVPRLRRHAGRRGGRRAGRPPPARRHAQLGRRRRPRRDHRRRPEHRRRPGGRRPAPAPLGRLARRPRAGRHRPAWPAPTSCTSASPSPTAACCCGRSSSTRWG